MLLFMDSFDHYTDAFDKYTSTSYSPSITTGRHGKGSHFGGSYIAFDNVQSRRCIPGAAWFPDSLNAHYFTISDLGDSILTLSGGGDGSLIITMPGANGAGATNEVARSEADDIKLHQWYFIELDALISTTFDGSYYRYVGDVVKVWVDGELVLDAAMLGPTYGYAHPPSLHNWNGVSHNSHITLAIIDDLYICDGSGPAPWNAPLGDVQIDVIRPNGAGAVTQWAAVGDPFNFGCVNDPTPDDDATRVIAATAGPSDLYQMEDIYTNNRIIGGQLLINARRTEEGYATLTPLLRHAGTTTDLKTRSLSPTYFYRNRDVFTVMPNGDPLTDANVAALEAGFRRET